MYSLGIILQVEYFLSETLGTSSVSCFGDFGLWNTCREAGEEEEDHSAGSKK
jgi:hypothetical protein